MGTARSESQRAIGPPPSATALHHPSGALWMRGPSRGSVQRTGDTPRPCLLWPSRICDSQSRRGQQGNQVRGARTQAAVCDLC